jgi:hypothetical protein
VRRCRKIERRALIDVFWRWGATTNMSRRLWQATAIFITSDYPALFCKAFVTEENKAILCDSFGKVYLLMDRNF